MPQITNLIPDDKPLGEALRDLTDAELVAQQLSNAGAIHALQYLLQEPLTTDAIDGMLRNLRECQAEVEAIQTERGDEPLRFQTNVRRPTEPNERTTP